MKRVKLYILILLLCVGARAFAQNEQPYLCELGLQGGIGYYVGDATPHIFMNPREAYGLHFRYKFTKRWAAQAKLSGQRVYGTNNRPGTSVPTFENRLYNFDIMGEFNFFRFGSEKNYDDRIKPFTPYIFLGIGTGWNCSDSSMVGSRTKLAWSSIYIPFGIGFKWKFSDRWGLNIAWQHNIYLPINKKDGSTELNWGDNIEGVDELNNPNGLNGNNIMNMDLTGMLTVGIVVEFGQAKKPCRICNE